MNLYAYTGGDPINWIDPAGLAIGDPPSKYPPGHDPGTWIPDGDNYWDPDGNHWSPHPEDKGHWPHWDKQYPDGKRERYPKKSKKPWPGQKKKPYGDQSAEDPNKVPECDDGCKRTITVGTMLFIIYNICTGGAGG